MKKIEKLKIVYEKISYFFIESEDSFLKKLGESFLVSVNNIDFHMKNSEANVSKINAGLEQGLLELPLVLAENNNEILINSVYEIIMENYSELLARQKNKIEKIISSGKIESLTDYYLISFMVDSFEGDPNKKDELKDLYDLLNKNHGEWR